MSMKSFNEKYPLPEGHNHHFWNLRDVIRPKGTCPGCDKMHEKIASMSE